MNSYTVLDVVESLEGGSGSMPVLRTWILDVFPNGLPLLV